MVRNAGDILRFLDESDKISRNGVCSLMKKLIKCVLTIGSSSSPDDWTGIVACDPLVVKGNRLAV